MILKMANVWFVADDLGNPVSFGYATEAIATEVAELIESSEGQATIPSGVDIVALLVDAHAIDGTENNHYDLARYAESKGFEVVGDTDDMQKSFIARQGAEDFGDRIIGEINGDESAKITMSI